MNVLLNILRYILDLFFSEEKDEKSKEEDNGEKNKNKEKDGKDDKQSEKLLNFRKIKGISCVEDETYKIQSIVSRDKVNARENEIWLVI